jgi:hypothetical protein
MAASSRSSLVAREACHNSLMGDEVSGGPPAGGRGRIALLVLVVAVLAVVGVMTLRRGVDQPEGLVAPTSPPPRQMPALPGQLTSPLPPTPELALGDVCRPVRASGQFALDVSFSLRNNGTGPVAVTAVEPKLPLAGLKERGYTIRAGSCPATGRTLTDNRLGRARPVEVAPATFVVATLHFALPDECPQAYPVLAVVTEQRGTADPISTDYTLLSDLGEVRFPNC